MFEQEADLHSLSFGVLRKAQKALSKAQAATDSEDDGDYADEVGPDEEESVAPTPRIDKSKEKEESKQKKEIPRRKNKHAFVLNNSFGCAMLTTGVGLWRCHRRGPYLARDSLRKRKRYVCCYR